MLNIFNPLLLLDKIEDLKTADPFAYVDKNTVTYIPGLDLGGLLIVLRAIGAAACIIYLLIYIGVFGTTGNKDAIARAKNNIAYRFAIIAAIGSAITLLGLIKFVVDKLAGY